MNAGARVADPTLVELLRRLVPAYQPERVYLFGSRARGEAGPESDYDLLLVVPDDAPPERRRSRLAYEALRGTGVAADVLVCTRTWFDRRVDLRASLPGTVLREGRLLHAASRSLAACASRLERGGLLPLFLAVAASPTRSDRRRAGSPLSVPAHLARGRALA